MARLGELGPGGPGTPATRQGPACPAGGGVVPQGPDFSRFRKGHLTRN
jgi:hypothetical protein